MVRKNKEEARAAVKAMVGIVAIIFCAELLIMTGLIYLENEPHSQQMILLDALILSLVTAPPIYWLVLRPIQREYMKRLEAEGLAENMSKLAITDTLTRIMNRRGITVGLLDAMAQAERYDHPLTVALADVDHFKEINDRHGHEAGDRVLAGVAGIMTDALRMPDKVGRYGGEEFLIILPHTQIDQATKIAERIRQNVGEAGFTNSGNKPLSVTISIGLTQFRRGEDLEQLVSRVDSALYNAKTAGRDRVIARPLNV